MEACGDVARQGPATRPGPTYVRCHPCEPPTVSQGGDSDYYFLPTCALCADRLEASLTGMAAETQPAPARPGGGRGRRCGCLAASTCAVCRVLYQAQTNASARGRAVCEACKQAGDPWICLICGYVGCSRYQAMHAKAHCLARQHFFSMNLLTQQIWDYCGDAFVHQVVMVFDVASGSTTRVRYPSREDLIFEGEDDEKDLFWQKKSISAKYDAKLRASHTQYATVIKNELDAMRQVYENDLTSAISNSQGEAPHSKKITEGEGGGNSVNLAVSSSPWKDSPAESQFQRTQASTPQKTISKAQHSPPLASMKTLHIITTKVLDAQEAALKGDVNLQGLSHDICLHTKEGAQLEERVHNIEREFRAIVGKNIAAEIEIDSAIEEMQTTLKEIRLNVETERRLRSQIDASDGAENMVIMGKGKKNM
ncbi:unnamed protein product [Phytomonas sp. Hart1]|nr:unnamed protein product [Phytomonas sp. Hart1]|eukprot:CCW66465.1 unnamed protein product [Phytomonas sp. isolate Hart1]